MRTNRAQNILVAVVGVACLAASLAVSIRLERQQAQTRMEEDPEELSLKGGKFKGFVFGGEGLVADWYWMRSLQYIGDKLVKSKDKQISIDDLTPLNPKLLYPLLDTATTLDPRFIAVYSYGATVLPAIDKEQAVKIAKKGIANNPDEWMLYHHLGFIYWKLGEYKNASETYRDGSKIRGAPDWMLSMSARMNTEGGSRETARAIYNQLYESANEDQTRENALIHLAELDSLDEREVLDSVLEEYRLSNGRCPSAWKEVFSRLAGKKLPGGREFRIDRDNNIVDPTDAPYLIDGATCTSKPDFTKSKLPKIK